MTNLGFDMGGIPFHSNDLLFAAITPTATASRSWGRVKAMFRRARRGPGSRAVVSCPASGRPTPPRSAVKRIQVQGVHPTTIVGSTRRSALDLREGVLAMPFVPQQPHLGKPDENHLYFDPGDGRLLTVFPNEGRENARRADAIALLRAGRERLPR